MNAPRPMRVMAAMSGGVDSSVAAALLAQQGCAVTGVTMCFNVPQHGGRRPACCGSEGIADAQRVALHLDIPHFVLGFSEAHDECVVRDFCSEYLRGRTPNPCVRCNQFLKFDLLLKKALAMGYDHLATGHYARIEQCAGGLYHLREGADQRKDQSYFLYRLGQDQMRHVLFPLGPFSKARIRALAAQFALPVADKAESQDVCFVPDADYRAFITARAPDAPALQPGEIVDMSGTVRGQHKGAAHFTVGQRTGLGIAHSHPLYVVRIDAAHNRVVVGARAEAERTAFSVEDVTWCAAPCEQPRTCRVKVRYNHPGAPCRITPHGARVQVECSQPVFAVTPGQSAVWYDGDEVLGGGIIADG